MLITRFLNSSASFSSVLVATASVGISPGQDEEGTSRKVERCIFNNWDSKDRVAKSDLNSTEAYFATKD